MNYACKSMHPNTEIQRGRKGGERERWAQAVGLQVREREGGRERERENMRSTPSIRAVYFLD
jgi:hypothetical protein